MASITSYTKADLDTLLAAKASTTGLSGEATTRGNADTALATSVTNEVTRAEAAEAALTAVTVDGTFTPSLAVSSAPLSLSDLSAPTADFALASHKLTGAADPTSAQDVATKNYVDGIAQGITQKHEAVAASITNVSLSGLPTVDGITLTTGQTVALFGQTTSSQNGLWAVASGSWTRPSFFATGSDAGGSYVYIQRGTVFAGSGFAITGAAPITIDTTAQAWSQFSGAGEITAGAGIAKSGNTLSIENSGVLTVPHGGTGAATLTGLVKGNGAGALTVATTADILTVAYGSTGALSATDPTLTSMFPALDELLSNGEYAGDAAGGATADSNNYGQTPTSGAVLLRFFRAKSSWSAMKWLKFINASTAPSGLTLVKGALFSYNGSTTLTQMDVTADVHTTYTGAYTGHKIALAGGAQNIVAGNLYALALLQIGTTCGSLWGTTGFPMNFVGQSAATWKAALLTGQSDMPSSILISALSASDPFMMFAAVTNS